MGGLVHLSRNSYRVLHQKILAVNSGMESKKQESLRQEMQRDYIGKSRMKILLVIFCCQLLRMVFTKTFFALLSLAFTNILPIVMFTIGGDLKFILPIVLLSFPIHYFLVWRPFQCSNGEAEIEDLNLTIAIAIDELRNIFRGEKVKTE